MQTEGHCKGSLVMERHKLGCFVAGMFFPAYLPVIIDVVLALLANIRLPHQNLAGTNTLAYFSPRRNLPK